MFDPGTGIDSQSAGSLDELGDFPANPIDMNIQVAPARVGVAGRGWGDHGKQWIDRARRKSIKNDVGLVGAVGTGRRQSRPLLGSDEPSQLVVARALESLLRHRSRGAWAGQSQECLRDRESIPEPFVDRGPRVEF